MFLFCLYFQQQSYLFSFSRVVLSIAERRVQGALTIPVLGNPHPSGGRYFFQVVHRATEPTLHLYHPCSIGYFIQVVRMVVSYWRAAALRGAFQETVESILSKYIIGSNTV